MEKTKKGELYDLYSSTKYYSGDQIKKNEMGGECGTYGRLESCLEKLGGRPEGKIPFGKPRRRWEDNIKMDV